MSKWKFVAKQMCNMNTVLLSDLSEITRANKVLQEANDNLLKKIQAREEAVEKWYKIADRFEHESEMLKVDNKELEGVLKEKEGDILDAVKEANSIISEHLEKITALENRELELMAEIKDLRLIVDEKNEEIAGLRLRGIPTIDRQNQ